MILTHFAIALQVVLEFLAKRGLSLHLVLFVLVYQLEFLSNRGILNVFPVEVETLYLNLLLWILSDALEVLMTRSSKDHIITPFVEFLHAHHLQCNALPLALGSQGELSEDCRKDL